ncbi:carbonic anhydrase [Actinoallomurus purpureus]|uniref:carbonic anhydrase n=1 Tax=Actinoallomurus purpureus TaxID=478114 RepID=UPI002093E118|nr:carbonic anhydrase [Actinoallomurus purpureus]MCO6009074.1 carbonic anhydrase [Actinoallomurus purpureus]
MQSLIDNARLFPQRAADRRTDLGRLAEGQHPEALFITCSDSRVVPTLITGAGPGELFELRTAGNIVPVHDAERVTAEAATIEYAVEVLEVTNIIVCGHSHCGAVGALLRAGDLTAIPSVQRWLAHTEPHDPVRDAMTDADGAAITSAVQRHVLTQLDRLRTHPSVAARVDDGRLALHAWFYAIDTGVVSAHRPRTGTFSPL